VYAIADDALKVIKNYGAPNWKSALAEFVKDKGKLIERYEKRRKTHLISVDLPNGALVNFSPGKHNELQVKVIQEFRKRFCPETKVVYVGDAARKLLHVDRDLLEQLKIPITEHDKLPDVVLYNPVKNHLFLIEAVTAHGPLSPKRQIELEETLKHSSTKRIYISALPDFREFKRHIDNIAWDTEVWIENNPDHMIHFNGPQFFTVYGA
jgi:type II restriction enzyme